MSGAIAIAVIAVIAVVAVVVARAHNCQTFRVGLVMVRSRKPVSSSVISLYLRVS